MNTDELKKFARQYTAAWNSEVPENVSSHFAEGATLSVNGEPATGREAITAVARSFMADFPDMELSMDTLVIKEDTIEYHWTFTGTNTGPGGTGNAVRFSGLEEWTMGGGLIAQSVGQFDQEEYEHQLEHGAGPGRP
jgi:predicted ester cyclase